MVPKSLRKMAISEVPDREGNLFLFFKKLDRGLDCPTGGGSFCRYHSAKAWGLSRWRHLACRNVLASAVFFMKGCPKETSRSAGRGQFRARQDIAGQRRTLGPREARPPGGRRRSQPREASLPLHLVFCVPHVEEKGVGGGGDFAPRFPSCPVQRRAPFSFVAASSARGILRAAPSFKRSRSLRIEDTISLCLPFRPRGNLGLNDRLEMRRSDLGSSRGHEFLA